MRACTGPCQQGRAPCPCPDACEVPEASMTRTALAIAAWFASVVVLSWALDSSPAEADTQAQAQARAELRRDAAAAQACPKGHTVHWVGARQMECLREVQP